MEREYYRRTRTRRIQVLAIGHPPTGLDDGQDYSWDHTFGWVPQAGDEGSYVIQVWARRSGTTGVYDSWLSSAPVNIGSN